MDENVRAFLRLQQACLEYALPPEQVVYEADPAAAAALLGRRGYVALPYSLADVSRPPIAVWAYEPWYRYTRMILPPEAPRQPLVYLGGRVSPAGERCLMAVEVGKNEDASMFFMSARVATEGTETRPPNLTAHPEPLGTPFLGGSDVFAFTLPLQRRRLRFYAGQSDVGDPSRFSIRFETREWAFGPPLFGVVNGRLLDGCGLDMSLRWIGDSTLLPPAERDELRNQLFAHFREMRERALSQDWTGIEARYRDVCHALAGERIMAAIAEVDTNPYAAAVADLMGRGAELAADRNLPAVYIEYDPHNGWATSAHPCGMYDARDLDWARGEAFIDGPTFEAFADLWPMGLGGSRAETGAAAYLAARTLAAHGQAARAADARGAVIYFGRHDDFDSVVPLNVSPTAP